MRLVCGAWLALAVSWLRCHAAGLWLLAGVGWFARVAGESLFVRATKSNQKTRRLSGWQSIPRCWFFERLRFPFHVVGRSTLLRILSGACVDGLLDEPDFRLLAAP